MWSWVEFAIPRVPLLGLSVLRMRMVRQLGCGRLFLRPAGTRGDGETGDVFHWLRDMPGAASLHQWLIPSLVRFAAQP